MTLIWVPCDVDNVDAAGVPVKDKMSIFQTLEWTEPVCAMLVVHLPETTNLKLQERKHTARD